MSTLFRMLGMVLLGCAGPSFATERLALAGAEYSGDNAYSYAGLLVPFPGSDLGNGFGQRYWVDWLRYEYESGGRTIEARALGASMAVGYSRHDAAVGAWSIYLGAVWRDTDLSPDDPGSTTRGSQWGLNVSLQGGRSLGKAWRTDGIASFTSTMKSYWLRGRLTRGLASGRSIGFEAIAHGNDDYSVVQAGAVLLDIRLAPQTTLGLKGGVRKSNEESIGAYIGIELGQSF